MNATIALLEAALDTMETNAPINRGVGKIAQAELEEANAKEYRKVLACLYATEGGEPCLRGVAPKFKDECGGHPIEPLKMRAKMKVTSVLQMEGSEELVMAPVCKPAGYPSSGLDEDNTFAKYSPSGELKLRITNPALAGKLKPGQTFYLDFTQATTNPTH